MTLFEKVKTALRMTKPQFDEEIQDCIDAAICDLNMAGVIVEPETPSCTRAIIEYCKWRFGEGDPSFQPIYEYDKGQLAHSSAYGGAYGQKHSD